MYKKILVLEMYAIVQIVSAKIPEREGSTLPSNFYGQWLSVVACTCNPATLEAEFRNGVGSIPVAGNSP